MMEACARVGGVRRVVMTSSVAAIGEDVEPQGEQHFNESNWTNTEKLTGGFSAYGKSKTLAERFAWDFVGKLEGDKKFELATVNPVLVLGPILGEHHKSSPTVVTKLMKREMPAVPELYWNLVDVR